MNAGRCYIVVGSLLFIAGLGMAIFGPFSLASMMERLEDGEIKDYVVVDSEKSSSYSDWAGGLDVKNTYQMVFYMWNLTNPTDVINGHKAIYTNRGPYVYRRYRKSTNVNFMDNGEKVSFTNFMDFVYDPHASIGPDTDMFTNVNPVWAGATMQTGGDFNTLVAGSNPFIVQGINFLTGPFIPLYTYYTLPEYFQKQMDIKLDALESHFSNSTDAMDYFLSVWVNATESPNIGGDWTGLMISQGKNKSSNISLEAARSLLDSQRTYSLLNPDPQNAWAWNEASTDLSTRHTIMITMEITESEFLMIENWIFNWFTKVYMFPDFVKKYDLDEVEDLGWAQWYNGAPLDYNFAQEVFPNLSETFPIGFEFFAANDSFDENTFESWRFCKKVMNNQTGLANMLSFQSMMLMITSGGDVDDMNFTQWGLTPHQADNFNAYALTIGGGIVLPAILQNSGPTGGLMVTKTVKQWVFDCTDFLIDILQPTAVPCGFLLNHTGDPTVLYTGKHDISKINQYVSWRGSSDVTGVWRDNVTVSGYTELGQFRPKDQGTSLYIWDTNLVKTVRLDYFESTTIKGIKANSYMFNGTYAFSNSSLYYQTIPGVGNISSTQNGSPMFLGYWDLIHVPDSEKKVIGLNNNATDYNSITIIDVEPRTGLTIQAKKRLQINVYIPPQAKSWLTLSPYGNQKFVVDTFYPIAKAGEYVTLSDESAKEMKNKLGLGPIIQNDLFYVYVTVGPALVVAGIIFIVFGLKRKNKEQYMQIN